MSRLCNVVIEGNERLSLEEKINITLIKCFSLRGEELDHSDSLTLLKRARTSGRNFSFYVPTFWLACLSLRVVPVSAVFTLLLGEFTSFATGAPRRRVWPENILLADFSSALLIDAIEQVYEPPPRRERLPEKKGKKRGGLDE